MSLRLGDPAPDFTQESTEGPIHFNEWKGDSWAILFSHPADFTPVCTTELGMVAKLKPEFDRRNVAHRPLRRPADSHVKWVGDIAEPVAPPQLPPRRRRPLGRHFVRHARRGEGAEHRRPVLSSILGKLRLTLTYRLDRPELRRNPASSTRCS
jgi:hypothetical protein